MKCEEGNLKNLGQRKLMLMGIDLLVLVAACVISYFMVVFTAHIPMTTKGVLWVVFFGLAKTFQYAALLILGTAGLTRIKAIFKYRK